MLFLLRSGSRSYLRRSLPSDP